MGSEMCIRDRHRERLTTRRVLVSIEEKVIAIVADNLDVDQASITRDSSFVTDLQADSLDTVELMMDLEEQFSIKIEDADAEQIQTVGAAIDFIEKQV